MTGSQSEIAEGISVIIPTFNAEKTVKKAIESVFDQDLAPCEILIVDDASSDSTLGQVEAFDDSRIQVIRLEKNSGPGAARNAGLELARGEYVAFLDADDWWLETKLSLQYAALRVDKSIALATCDSVYRTPTGELKRRSHEVLPPVAGKDAWKTLLAYNFMPTPTVMARRDVLLEVGGFANELEFGEDLDLWIRTSLKGEVAVVPEVLVEIVEWSGSLTGTIRHLQPDFVLPFIERYLTAQALHLSEAEVRAIRGRRLFESGNLLFYGGHTFKSLRYFARSASRGYRIVKSLLFFPKAIVSWLSLGRYPGTEH